MSKKTCYGFMLAGAVLLLTIQPAWAHWSHRHHVGPRVGFSFHIGIPVVPYVYRPYYPVVVREYVPYYPSPSVVYTPPRPVETGQLQIVVAPLQAEMYLDGRYIGRAEEFRDGRVDLPVTSGNHGVELRFGTTSHTHIVYVQAGSTVVVSDRLR
jgi:hypothetical protein